MKKLFFTLLLLSQQAYSFEWEAGVREMFLSPYTYHYNSDSMARVIRDLNDRGYERISAHPRLVTSNSNVSLVSNARIRTSLEDLGFLNSRVTLLDAKLTIKPLMYETEELGESRPAKRFNPEKPIVFLTSYEQQMATFAKLSREKSFARFVVGSGIGHLLADSTNAKRIEQMLIKLRKTTSKKTELLFEIVGDKDILSLKKAVSEGFRPHHSIDGVSLVLDVERHFTEGALNERELEKTLETMESLLPGLPVHLSRVVIPSCNDYLVQGEEIYCGFNPRNNQLQLQRLLDLKSKLLELSEKGYIFNSVEIMESNTDFEPVEVDSRYLYYNEILRSPDILALPKKKIPLAPVYPVKTSGGKLACVYYDKLDSPPFIDRMGDIHSLMLEANLGAFKNWQVKRLGINEYYVGQMQDCGALFYFATNYMTEHPVAFLKELSDKSISTPVVWFNYNFNSFVNVLQSMDRHPGFEVPYVLQAETTPSITNLDPGFYRFFDYKGEAFFKSTEWNYASNNYAASTEINGINIIAPEHVDVLSMARHSWTDKEIPYVVRSGNIWYFADSPMSFTHYEDRYYILADILWDILGEEAPTKRIALARFEDIAPNTNVDYLRWAIDYMHSVNAPFSLAVIPKFIDIIGINGKNSVVHESIEKYPRLVQAIRYATQRGGSVVMHGVSHALGNVISGYDGLTGSDYEFWLYPENTPLPFDTVDWFTKRIERGIEIFNKLGFKPAAFEVPHYAASVMNYMILGKMFHWNYHRTVYFPFKTLKDTGLPEELKAFKCRPEECGDRRRAILNNINVEVDYHSFGGVPVPYIIYRDPYGQSVIPETLGMIDFAFYGSKTWRPVSKPEDIVRRAKKLKVIRGAVASFFWHPQLLDENFRYYREVPNSYESIGGKNSLRLVVDGIKDLGYEFVSINNEEFFPVEVE